MNKTKTLICWIANKVAAVAAVAVLIGSASAPLFAQTAEVRYAGVFYQNAPTTVEGMYCDYQDPAATIAKFKTASSKPSEYGTNTTGATVNVNQTFTDGDYLVQLIAKGQTASQGTVRQNNKKYDLLEMFYVSYKPSGTSTTFYDHYQIYGYASPTSGFSFNITQDVDENRSFTYADKSPVPGSAMAGNSTNGNIQDPWVSSALIEYDQPYPKDKPGDNMYPNHCLALCMNVYCTNKPLGGSTYSITFPLQEIKFDIVKYYNQKNLANADEVPAQRTINLYPNVESATCGSYHCPGKSSSGTTCNGAQYYCESEKAVNVTYGTGDNKNVVISGSCTKCHSFADGSLVGNDLCSCKDGVCTFAVWNNDGTPSNGNAAIPFCAAWDGSYEIAGEFGKSNGQFGFRATVATDAPGDNVTVDSIKFNSTIVYPGMNQIPIQVDVTNIHTVRSTPSLVGSITAVSAEPYTYSYRLSKDADVRIAIFDASNGDELSYGDGVTRTRCVASSWDTTITDPIVCGNTTNKGAYGDFYQADWNTTATGCCKGVQTDPNNNLIIRPFTVDPSGKVVLDVATEDPDLVRTLVDWQPRLGEGMKGVEKDVQISEFDSWDGRGDNGLLLPAGNYVVSLQAKSQDEWSGVDFSRAVTRQLSLDPLKLTDVVSVGLNKQSTAYASIRYVATESAKVYWNIYTPGTTFENVLTNSAAPTGTAPTIKGNTGSLVYSAIENRTGRMNFTSKWDGLCGVQDGCTRTYTKGEKKSDGTTAAQGDTESFAYGAPMPDGNYVYALWAEIPYNGCYYNKSSLEVGAPKFVANTACTDDKANTKQFTGVKTLKYTTGIISVDRGVVDATIQPVSYSTVGSSPTAYGLDPFIFKYSIARDATVIAKVENTAGVVVKYLTPQEGITQVAQQMNTMSWDGRDNAGRMVYPGTYMFVVETKDAMFPSVTNRAAAVFPVDMYRVVDVSTTDVYGDSNAKATISYKLSKAMNTQINIYNKDVVIPDYNNKVGEYAGYTVTATYTGSKKVNNLTSAVSITPTGGAAATLPGGTLTGTGTYTAYDNARINEWTVSINPAYVEGGTVTGDQTPKYIVSLTQKNVTLTGSDAAWPPRVCNYEKDKTYMKNGTNACTGTSGCHIDPSTNPQCIYVRDPSFTNYPKDLKTAQSGIVDVRLQPIHTFDRSATRVGDGFEITEEWDALYFYNPTPSAARHTPAEIAACKDATNKTKCPYEMLSDGQYPFYISARSNEPFNRYYYDLNKDGTISGYTLTGQPFKQTGSVQVKQEEYLYATEKPVSKINITRGPVYFLDGSTVVYPNAPQLFNVSSGPIFVPPYEINFSVSRAATVEVAVVALKDGVCNSDPNIKQDTKSNKAGDVCKFLSTMTIANTSNFDPNIVRKMYWDGTDMNGFYVKPDVYEIRLTARNYPDAGLYQETVKSITLNADLLKVFDLLEADGYAISQRGTDMRIGYQVSVPMKVAIQILKPGTTIYDYQKGTLRNPTTGKEVQDIREVLVRAIVGIRPATTLIEEVWDGTDYAGQEVPDGTYPFRFVTALNSADIDTVTGEIIGDYATTDALTSSANWKINKVADTYEYQNLHKATVAIGDGRFVCSDWEKTVFFYPNPLKNADRGTLEITKMPVPGEVSIKFFNLAGDLVRDSGYTCVDANNYQTTMGNSLSFNPDNNVSATPWTNFDLFPSQRNAALRCRWDRTNQHGKKVARGVYFGLVDFKAKNGREHCQKVVKVLVP